MDRQVQQRDNNFVIGLLTGAFVGAGLALWLTPGSAAEARGRVTGSARRFGEELARKSDERSRSSRRDRGAWGP